MWELDHKEVWAPKSWCFWTVMLEETLESSLDCKGIKPVNLHFPTMSVAILSVSFLQWSMRQGLLFLHIADAENKTKGD